MISDTPTNARPTSMMKIPVHITLRIVDPRNATDKRAVKMMTAPNKDYLSLGKIQKKIIDDATLPVTAIHVLFLIIKILKQPILVIKAVKIHPRLPSTLVMMSSYYV